MPEKPMTQGGGKMARDVGPENLMKSFAKTRVFSFHFYFLLYVEVSVVIVSCGQQRDSVEQTRKGLRNNSAEKYQQGPWGSSLLFVGLIISY